MENKFYYKDGTTSSEYDNSNTLHRTDGPAAEYPSGSKEWWVDGRQHRTDGPAAEYSDGRKCWFICGRQHRIDGPAIEYGSGTKAWYIDDKYYSEEDFNKFIAEVKQLPLALRLIDPREWVRNYGK